MLGKMTPKQFIKYTRWLDKKGLALCDGSTMEQNPIDLIQLFITIGGIAGIYGIIRYTVYDKWKRKEK